MTKIRFTPYISKAVLDSARAAVVALTGQVPEARTLNVLVEHALRREVQRLQRGHNGGEPFPTVDSMPGSGGRR